MMLCNGAGVKVISFSCMATLLDSDVFELVDKAGVSSGLLPLDLVATDLDRKSEIDGSISFFLRRLSFTTLPLPCKDRRITMSRGRSGQLQLSNAVLS